MLTYTLMKEPVLLPTSGNICDLANIKRHLLNKEHDPFNRAPLKISDLVPQDQLKSRIEKWIKQKLAGEETDEEKRLKMQVATEMTSPQIPESDYSEELLD